MLSAAYLLHWSIITFKHNPKAHWYNIWEVIDSTVVKNGCLWMAVNIRTQFLLQEDYYTEK